jgi:hypothetical protein
MGQVSMANKKLLSIIAAAGRSRNQEKKVSPLPGAGGLIAAVRTKKKQVACSCGELCSCGEHDVDS